uniref:PP1-binding domain-containing protein n=1 Tax=Cyanoderma ruficeps TaxID=181631 RepID=A0A8C3R9Q0_9PASS
MSPFTQLYEDLKNEVKVKKPLHRRSASQQGAKGDPGNVLPEPSAPIPSLSCPLDLGSSAKGKEAGRKENVEECLIVREGNSPGFNQLSAAGGRTPRRSFARSPRTPISKEVSADTGQSPLQVPKEFRTPGRSKGTAVPPKPSKENHRDSLVLLDQCSIERWGHPAEGTVSSPTTPTPCPAGGAEGVNTPTPRRKSPRSLLVSPPKESPGMNPGHAETPRVPRRGSLKLKSLPEIPAGAPGEDPRCRIDNTQLPLPDDKCLKQRRSSKQQTPGKPAQEVLKEIWDQANLDNSKVGHCETPASLPNSKSPGRNSRESKEFLDKSAQSEVLASEGISASPAAQTPGRKRPRTSGVLAEAALETNTAQEQHDTGRKASATPAELAMDSCHQNQDLEDASATTPLRPSAKRRSGSAAELRDTEPGSETKTSGEDSGKTKGISQKRKSGETLPQTLGKRKRVSFGGHLSPELFDKSLPPNSPLKRGALPARRSLPNGNSPRAVLKKAQGLKNLIDQEEKRSPKNSPAQQSPGASSLLSGKAAPKIPAGSPVPWRKGRFSMSRPPTPFPIAEEEEAGTEDLDPEGKSDAQVKTPKSSPATPDGTALVTVTSAKSARGAQLGVKGSARRSRGGAVAVISAKRRSGASSANLLVAKSWAEVVKLGVARPQSKIAKKSVPKGRALKRRRNHPAKTPEKKIKDHFSTGHAESPATIVVGRAYSTTVRSAGHVPKVVKNPKMKLNMDMDESFTGMPEMFQTPENTGGGTFPLTAAQNADCTPPWAAGDISDLHTPEESGEMMVSPLNNSDASQQKQESPGIFSFLREESSPSVFDEIATKTPEKRKAVHEHSVDSLAVVPQKPASLVKSGSKRRTPKQKLKPVVVMSGKRKILRTPEQRSEAGEVLSGIKRLLKTPKQKLEPVEALSGVKQLMRTPKQKLEPVEALSGVKQLMRTPKQKLESVEALSGIKRLLKTPKQKLEPVEALSGIKQLLKTPKQKLEPVEALSGVKQLMRTPKQKLEPVEALSGVKQLMRTPRRKAEHVEDLSGIKQLLRTPQQELEPVLDEIALKKLLETPVESREAEKTVPGVTSTKKTPKLKSQPVEDMVGISRIFQTPKEKVEPIENMFGISRLMKSPKEKHQPVEDFVGLQRLMAEPRQKPSDSEVDYTGVTEIFATPEEMKVRSVNVVDSQEEIALPGSNSSQNHEKKGKVSQEDSQQKDSTGEEQHTQRPRRGRPRRAEPPAAAMPSEIGVSLRESKSPDTQEEMGVVTPENKGRGRRTKRRVQEVAPKCPDQEGLDIVSSVEPAGAAQRPGRGKRKKLKELDLPNDNLESCVEDSSVLQKAPANTKQSLQDCGISETEGDPGTETGAGNTRNEICQLPTGLNDPDSKANDSGIEDSEEVLLPLRRRRRGVENTEPVIPPKRGRRARNDQGEAAPPADFHGTTRKLRKDPSPKVTQRQEEQACDKAPEAVTAQESENGTKLELKATERRVKSFRSTRNRKHSAEIKADTRVALENPQNIQKTEETSTGTDAETQSHVKIEMKESQGYETENAQEKTTQAAPRLKAESPSAETNKMPVSAQNMEAKRARNRRGKKDSLEQKADEFPENVNCLKPITPKFKSEAEVDEFSLQGSVGSVCVSAAQAKKVQPSPGVTSVPAADGATPAQGSQRGTRNERGILKAKQTEILQGNPAQRNAVMGRRGRGKKVNFQLEEGSSKAIQGKSLPEGDEGMTDKDNQHENSENPPSQGRRGRRKQLDSIPQKANPAFMAKQELNAEHRNDEAVVQEQGSALEVAPSSAEDNPPRRGRRWEAAAAPQTGSPVRTRRGVLGGDAKKMAERENENPALGNKTSQAKVNASARGRRRKVDPAAEAACSAPLQRKCGLSGTEDEGTQEEQSVPLETVSCAKSPGRGRRKGSALASHTTNSISLWGRRGLPAGDGEEAPKEEQNVPLETCDPPGKENQLPRGRRKEIAPLIEAESSIQGNQLLSKQSGRKNNNREAKQSLDNSSQENASLVKGSSRQASTSPALGPTLLQGFPEDGKDRIPEEQSKLLEVAPPAKENPSRVGRKKTTSPSEGTISTSLRGKPNRPRGRGQKRILKETEDASPENNPCQGRTRQLRNNRRKVEFALEAATSASPHKSSDLPENGNALETRDLSGASTDSKGNRSGKGQEGDPAPQAAPSSCRRKRQLPAEEVAPKKFKSGNDENGSLQRGRRNKTKLGEEDARAAQTTGGMEKSTRSSTRTRK